MDHQGWKQHKTQRTSMIDNKSKLTEKPDIGIITNSQLSAPRDGQTQ